MKIILLFLTFYSAMFSLPAQEINNIAQLLVELKNKTNRYETLTFVQQTISYQKNGEADTAIWFEAIAPGKLRIDFAPITDGNGVLYLGDTRYDFENNIRVGETKDYNPLMLFLSDIYHLPAPNVLYIMDSLNYNSGIFRKISYNGNEVYVIGAAQGDTLKNQVWLDAELLLPIRIIQMIGKNKNIPLDAHISGYKKIENKYVETVIKIYINGRLVQDEYYQNIKVNPVLNEQLFDPENWKTTDHYWE